MKKRLILLGICLSLAVPPAAYAGFGYTPAPAAPAPSAPIIKETAEDIKAGKPMQQPVPVSAAPALTPMPMAPAVEPKVASAPLPATAPIPAYQAPAYQAAPAYTPPMAAGFTLQKGSLRDQLKSYAASNGYQLTWNHPDDLVVNNETSFSGSFLNVLENIFGTLHYIGRKDIGATIFEGNKTVVVEPTRR